MSPEPKTPPHRQLIRTDTPGIYRRGSRYVVIAYHGGKRIKATHDTKARPAEYGNGARPPKWRRAVSTSRTRCAWRSATTGSACRGAIPTSSSSGSGARKRAVSAAARAPASASRRGRRRGARRHRHGHERPWRRSVVRGRAAGRSGAGRRRLSRGVGSEHGDRAAPDGLLQAAAPRVMTSSDIRHRAVMVEEGAAAVEGNAVAEEHVGTVATGAERVLGES